ncbi:MAG: SDR family oxidoreductase [Actinomycetota bacterium]
MTIAEKNFEGQVVVVTGGTKGIGKVIAENFLRVGAEVVVCARNAPEVPIAYDGRQANFVTCDVRDHEQIKTVIALCEDSYGKLDILVNNAGGAPPADSSTASERFTRSVIDLNLVSTILFSQEAANLIRKSIGTGVILNISSVSGMRANPLGVAYGAAKAGVINATETLALEWGPNIRVVSITAGLILTDESRSFYGDDESVAKIAATLPMQRLGDPQDVANACLFAASDKAKWISGSNIVLHGGGDKPTYLEATDLMKGS